MLFSTLIFFHLTKDTNLNDTLFIIGVITLLIVIILVDDRIYQKRKKH